MVPQFLVKWERERRWFYSAICYFLLFSNIWKKDRQRERTDGTCGLCEPDLGETYWDNGNEAIQMVVCVISCNEDSNLLRLDSCIERLSHGDQIEHICEVALITRDILMFLVWCVVQQGQNWTRDIQIDYFIIFCYSLATNKFVPKKRREREGERGAERTTFACKLSLDIQVGLTH